MFKKLIPLAAIAAVLAIASTHSALAQSAPVTVKCVDGTTSTVSTSSAKGACSHHGGIVHSSTAGASTTNHPPPPAPSNVPPAASASGVPCGDGTMSTATGKGACSHHGGIAHSSPGSASTTKIVAPAAAPITPNAPAAPITPNAPPAATITTSPRDPATPTSNAQHPDNNPQGATAQCKDGTYSHAAHHSGACSSHGGVAKWLDTKPAQ